MKFSFQGRKRSKSLQTQKLIASADQNRDLRRWEQARDLYAQALHTDKSLDHIWVQYGHALKESGDRLAALAAYKTAFDLEPANADTALQIAHCVKLLGDIDQATHWYLRALELDPREYHAEKELRFLGVPVELHLPDIEKRRAPVKSYSVLGRPVFLCVTSLDLISDPIGRFKETLYRDECLPSIQSGGSFGICQLSSRGEFEILDGLSSNEDAHHYVARQCVPDKSAVIIGIDAWLDVMGVGAAILEEMHERDLLPILFIDKNMDKTSAVSFLNDKSALYLSARLLSTLTLAIDGRTVSTLDSVASITQHPLSQVFQVERDVTDVAEMTVSGNAVVIVARDLDSGKLKNILSAVEEAGSADRYQVLYEHKTSSNIPSTILTAGNSFHIYSREGIAALKSARLAIIVDDCADGARWITIARRMGCPVISGLLESNFRIWGRAIVDYVDFSNIKSLSRLTRAVQENGARHRETAGAEDTERKRPHWMLQKLKSYAWTGRSGSATLQFGEFYAFRNSGFAADHQNVQSAERFQCGSNWIASRQGCEDGAFREVKLSAHVDLERGQSLQMRLLIVNEHETANAELRWTSPRGAVSKTLHPRQRVWLDMQAVPKGQSGDYTFSVGWSGQRGACTPLGFVAFPSDQEASWSGFLDVVSQGKRQGLLERLTS
ncbi:hypothetical protein [Pararhizobium sp. LjRoot238]|uniref:hypothetical protein n=1 Tax=Pararhizobium sp. LjRoot238 TaxID=3342293 RepID=UPI003ECDE837